MRTRLVLLIILSIAVSAAIIGRSAGDTGASDTPPSATGPIRGQQVRPAYPRPAGSAAAAKAPTWARPTAAASGAARVAPTMSGGGSGCTTAGSACTSTLSVPANDDVASAALIGTPLPFTANEDTSGATLEAGESPACGVGSATVWFSFTADVTETLMADTFGSDYDTAVDVYTPGGSPPGALVPENCSDNVSDTNLQSQTFLPVVAGNTYLLQVGGVGGATGNLVLHVDVLPPGTCPVLASTFSFTTPDPVGDAFGAFPPNHDITSVSGSGDASTFCLTVAFAAPVDPADAGTGNEVVGVIDFDTDQDANTGSSGFVDSFCPKPSNTGGDVEVSLFAVANGLTYVNGFPEPVVFNGSSFTVILPLQLLGGDPNFNIAMVLGAFGEPTDCAPGDGGCIESPSGAVCVPPPAPPNDNFADATLIEEPLPFSDAVSTTGATTEVDEPLPCGGMSLTVWYRFTPSSDVTLVADTVGSSFDTVLAAYDNVSSPPGSPHFLTCDDNAVGTLQSRVIVPALAGVTYYFQAGGAFRARGDLVFHLAAAPDANCPSGNDGFEAGLADTSLIPCWSVSNEEGGSGSWCNQAGTETPEGDCAGDFAVVAPPPEQSQAAMTNQASPGAHALYRCGFLSSAEMSFNLYLNNEAGTFVSPPTLDAFGDPNQQFRADLVSAANIAQDPFTTTVLMNVYQTQPGDAAVSEGYNVVSLSAGDLVGQNVCLRFVEVDNQLYFHVGIDDVHVGLDVSAATPTRTPTATATSTPSATFTPTATSTPTACADVTHDGVVTLRDVLAVAHHIGRHHYDARYDVDHNGVITLTDLTIVIAQLGRTC